MDSCTIIGLTDMFPARLSKWARKKIRRAAVFCGTRRHQLLAQRLLPDGYRWIDSTGVGTGDLLERLAEEGHVVMFASCDPLFFGIVPALMERFPGCNVKVYAQMNPLQMLAHRLNITYHDMRAVSLVGLPWQGLDEAMSRGERLIGLLLDEEKTPHDVARRMGEGSHAGGYRLYVGSRLGNEMEVAAEYSPDGVYASPCCMMAVRVSDGTVGGSGQRLAEP